MKIHASSLDIQITFKEAKALIKMIGPTSNKERMDNFGLTESESEALEVMYSVLAGILGDE